MQHVSIRDQNFVLHRTGALFWKERDMLLISDVHLGKVSHFRKFGAAIPHTAIYGNYKLLDEAIGCFGPKSICFLGDLFHSKINGEWAIFEHWVSNLHMNIVLVEGNHDVIPHLRYETLGIRVVPELSMDSFLLTHHPEIREGYFNFSGHIHPAVRLRGKGRQRLRLPCFFGSNSQMILPAFGTFTGSHILEPKENDLIYALTGEMVVPITLEAN